MFYSVTETRDFSLFNQSAQALLKGYFIITEISQDRRNIFSIGFILGERACILSISASTWARDAIATLLVWYGQ